MRHISFTTLYNLLDIDVRSPRNINNIEFQEHTISRKEKMRHIKKHVRRKFIYRPRKSAQYRIYAIGKFICLLRLKRMWTFQVHFFLHVRLNMRGSHDAIKWNYLHIFFLSRSRIKVSWDVKLVFACEWSIRGRIFKRYRKFFNIHSNGVIYVPFACKFIVKRSSKLFLNYEDTDVFSGLTCIVRFISHGGCKKSKEKLFYRFYFSPKKNNSH